MNKVIIIIGCCIIIVLFILLSKKDSITEDSESLEDSVDQTLNEVDAALNTADNEFGVESTTNEEYKEYLTQPLNYCSGNNYIINKDDNMFKNRINNAIDLINKKKDNIRTSDINQLTNKILLENELIINKSILVIVKHFIKVFKNNSTNNFSKYSFRNLTRLFRLFNNLSRKVEGTDNKTCNIKHYFNRSVISVKLYYAILNLTSTNVGILCYPSKNEYENFRNDLINFLVRCIENSGIIQKILELHKLENITSKDRKLDILNNLSHKAPMITGIYSLLTIDDKLKKDKNWKFYEVGGRFIKNNATRDKNFIEGDSTYIITSSELEHNIKCDITKQILYTENDIILERSLGNFDGIQDIKYTDNPKSDLIYELNNSIDRFNHNKYADDLWLKSSPFTYEKQIDGWGGKFHMSYINWSKMQISKDFKPSPPPLSAWYLEKGMNQNDANEKEKESRDWWNSQNFNKD